MTTKKHTDQKQEIKNQNQNPLKSFYSFQKAGYSSHSLLLCNCAFVPMKFKTVSNKSLLFFWDFTKPGTWFIHSIKNLLNIY